MKPAILLLWQPVHHEMIHIYNTDKKNEMMHIYNMETSTQLRICCDIYIEKVLFILYSLISLRLDVYLSLM